MSEKERIELLMRCYELTPSQFADRAGIQRASISHIISGRNKPSLEVMLKIYEAFPGLDMKWLMTGEGEMPSAAPQHASVAESNLFSSISQPILHQVAANETIDAQGFSNRQELPVPRVQQQQLKPVAERQQKRNASSSRSSIQQPAGVRKIKEVRIFYTDGTYETLVPEK